MNNLNSRRKIILFATLAALYIPAIYILSGQLFFASETDRNHILPPADSDFQRFKDDFQISGPRNSTLGFQKIFYISMPERTDRQDAMNLIASYMGLDFTYVPGVNGSTIIDKALPYDPKKKPPKAPNDAELGCWRAHANIWTEIVQSGISSALILEDDIDFTTGIRDVLTGVSEHLKHLTGAQKNQEYGLANGDSWDVLSLGHCWNERPPQKTHPISSQIYEAWEDLYAPAKEAYSDLLPGAKSQRIRVLQPTYVVVCTQAYVVSLAGAQRLLYHIGGPGGVLYEPIDIVMMNKFRDGKIKGYTAVPSIFSQWKYGDFRDTDIQKPQKPEDVETGSGGDIIKSVRREMSTVWGGRNIWKEIESKSKSARAEKLKRRRQQA